MRARRRELHCAGEASLTTARPASARSYIRTAGGLCELVKVGETGMFVRSTWQSSCREKMSGVSKMKSPSSALPLNANYRNVENYLIVGSVLYKNKMRKAVIFPDEAWFRVRRNENPRAVLGFHKFQRLL